MLKRFEQCCGWRDNRVGRRCCAAEAAPQRSSTFVQIQSCMIRLTANSTNNAHWSLSNFPAEEG
jgi:hypothetical protein